MPLSFLPAYRIRSITDLTADDLRRLQIRLLMLDFDNTIVPYTTDVPTKEMEQWLKNMLATEIKLCVVSNSRNDRVKRFCKKYGIDCITHARKPFSKGIVECLNRYQIDKQFCALAGDQIYTDTLGANCAGVRAILVQAIHNHTIWLKLRNMAEIPFICIAKNRRIK